MKKNFLTVLILFCFSVTYSQYAVKFNDDRLEYAVRDTLNNFVDSIYPSDMLQITSLKVSECTSLQGLEYATNLKNF